MGLKVNTGREGLEGGIISWDCCELSEVNEQLYAAVADPMRNPAKYNITDCLLCGNTQLAGIAFWEPSEVNAKRIGQPEGKLHRVLYGLYNNCQQLPDCADRVEVVLLR